MRTILVIFAIAVTGFSIFIIFMGCNSAQPEFDFTKNKSGADSIEKKCGKYPNASSPGSFVTQYEKCVNRQVFKENVCTDYFWWLRY